jgi:homoserine O-acetyltransferase
VGGQPSTEVDAIVALAERRRPTATAACGSRAAISALTADPRWKGGDYTEPPVDGIKAWSDHWAAWVYSQEWWRRETVQAASSRRRRGDGRSREGVDDAQPERCHSAGANVAGPRHRQDAGFDGNIEHALAAIRVPVLYMPGATDLYFRRATPSTKRKFLTKATFVPIPSLWGHTAGGGGNPDRRRVHQQADCARFLK